MKTAFPEYYPLEKYEVDELWDQACFVFDTNVLLNVYRYSVRSRERLLSVMDHLSARIWLPHQFALEFHENRLKVIWEQITSCRTAAGDIRQILKTLNQARKHPFVSSNAESALSQVVAEAAMAQAELEQLLSNDMNLERLTQLFAGRVGEPPDDAELSKLCDEGHRRHSSKIPPGYLDDKPEPRKYGDYIGWRQTMNFAKGCSKDVLLITDEESDDWWQLFHGRTLGPRREMIREFRQETGQRFHMYHPDQFVTHASRLLGLPVEEDVIEEMREPHESGSSEAESPKADVPKKSELRLEKSNKRAPTPPSEPKSGDEPISPD